MTNIKCKVIGGITFNLYDIKEHHHVNDLYTVKLKDNTMMIYHEQDASRESEVHIDQTGRIDFKGLFEVEIIDTKKNDIYRLMGCENVTLKADQGGESANIDSDLIQVTHRRTSKGIIQYSKNNKLLLDKNDLYSLPGDSEISLIENDIETIS